VYVCSIGFVLGDEVAGELVSNEDESCGHEDCVC